MKRIIATLAAASLGLPAIAQMPDTTHVMMPVPKRYTTDEMLGRWTFDINAKVGSLSQNPTYAASNTAYLNAIGANTTLGALKFTDGMTYGADANLGFFFGRGRHWGIGAGFQYLMQRGNAKLDRYHAEYQAVDRNGEVYRQLVTGRNLEERLEITNLNIPVLLKYKARFSRALGFTADIGALYNLQMRNEVETRASFDYEAIYNYSVTGTNPATAVAYFDPSPAPSGNAVLITRDFYQVHNPEGNVFEYFTAQYNTGRNVGLGARPANRESTVSYKKGSIGFMVQPGLNIFLSDHVALNLSAYYIYQKFENNPMANYRLTGNMGEYSSMLNSVSETENHSIGGNFGVRFLFGKAKDTDKDGIPDKRDKCPEHPGLVQFMGCPDTDKDGIADPEDSCYTVAGLVQFHGCPDTDNDGIPDREDQCPYQAGPERFRGCPDRDGDGIIDRDDRCPDKPGLEQYHGCADTDGDGIADDQDQCPDQAGPADNHGCPPPPPPPPVETVPLSTPILFEVNKTVVAQSSMPVLETAIQKLKDDNGETLIIVDGYTDNTGSHAYNKKLSVRRALAVKRQLVKMGANPKRIRIVGHGESKPAASNKTREGRMQNRRAVMRLKVQ